MCWYVPTCASMCRHVLICADMWWYVTWANMWHHSRHIWYQPFGPYFIAAWCVSAHVDTLICADMSRYVPTCSITLDTSNTNHLDLICMLACVKPVDMPICADMCEHVTSISAHVIPIIWTLSACWHVSAHVDMPTCVDMCQHVPTCANMWNHSRHFWYQPFGPYFLADMCQHIWTYPQVLICADMYPHVASLSAPLIPIIWTLSACRHVLIYADMC